MGSRPLMKCPHCQTIGVNRSCASGRHRGRCSVYTLGDEEIAGSYFKRVRQCDKCGKRWATAVEFPTKSGHGVNGYSVRSYSAGET